MSDTSWISRNTGRRRALVLFAAASAVTVDCGAATLSFSGVPFGSWIRNPLARMVGGLLSVGICRRSERFPVPFVGLGMSFPVGYWLGIALLCANWRSDLDAKSR